MPPVSPGLSTGWTPDQTSAPTSPLDTVVVADLMGHATLDTTRSYTRSSEADSTRHRPRLVVVDEAWLLMRQPEGARFLWRIRQHDWRPFLLLPTETGQRAWRFPPGSGVISG